MAPVAKKRKLDLIRIPTVFESQIQVERRFKYLDIRWMTNSPITPIW